MKFSRLLLVLVIWFVPLFIDAQSTTLSNGLVGHWKFDSIGTNYSITDDSGSGNTGTVGTSSRLVSGKFGQALRFDLGGRWQHMTTGQNFSANNWTISAWVNPDRPITTSSPYFGNIAVFSGTTNEALTISGTGVYYFRTKVADYNFDMNTGWRHVALTFDGSTLSAYVDGVRRGSVATTTNMFTGSSRRLIGTLGQGNYGHVFVGAIDEVRLYNRVASDTEISTLSGVPSLPGTTAPATKFIQNLVITTDKVNYRVGENVTMTATFTPSAEWVQYLRTNNIAQGEVKFHSADPGNRFLLEKTFRFDLVASQIRQQYVWATPVTPSLAGTTFSIDVSVYDVQKITTESRTSPTLSFEPPALTNIVVSPDVVTSRLPAGVSPHLFGKILAERDISNEFTTSLPHTLTTNQAGADVDFSFLAKNRTIDLTPYNGLWLVIENQSRNNANASFLPQKAEFTRADEFIIWTNFKIPANSGKRHILVSLVDPTTTIFKCDKQNGMQRCPIGPDQIPAVSQEKSAGFQSFTRDQLGRMRIYIRDSSSGDRLTVHSIRAVNINYRPENMTGFVDRWGQNNWTEFNGKINSDDQLKSLGRQDSASPNPLPANWDQYGGDTRYGGYTSAGFFKTQKVDGKWWLVSPAGNLFYAKGQSWVTINNWGTTIRNRPGFFSNIPTRTGLHTPAYSEPRCQPNNNNIDGTGEFCGGLQWSPYYSNVITKYSTGTNTNADIIAKWGTVTRNRLQDWGFNVITSTGVVPKEVHMPYVVLPYLSTMPGVTRISGTNMPEVFASTFKDSVESGMSAFSTYTWLGGAPRSGTRGPQDPYNVGIFSDNELYFGRGTDIGPESDTYYLVYKILSLNGATSPSKNAFTNKLRQQYGTIAALRSSWRELPTSITTWENFNTSAITRAPREDLSMLLRYYADEYYRISRDAIKKYYPNHLYLGSRYAGFYRTPNEAIDSCEEYCDVISINYYENELKENEWRYLLSKDKPIMLTEWHVGVLSRGAAFGGHGWTFGEAAAAEVYKRYMRSVFSKNQIVGYFYFSYADMPISGMNFESENMYPSFVTTSDQPKPDMVNAAKDINSRVYSIRGARANNGNLPQPPVNTAPVAQPVTVNTTGDAVTINYSATDAEGSAITYNNGLAPTRGTLVRVAEGRYTYTPNTPLPSTAYTDTYNYNATDGSLTSPATRVTINYTPRQYVLTVSKTGNGTITATGINCGGDCTETINTGTSVTLTATPATGHSFTGWSGACTGTGTCTTSMTQDRAVAATFTTINTTPTAQGASYNTSSTAFNITLTASDAQNDTLTFIPSTPTLATLTRVSEGVYRYALRTPLPTARATDTFTFTASDGRLTSAPATVSIVFTPTPPTQFSLNTAMVGQGTITGTGINCGVDCTERVNTGTSITLTAQPATGHMFSGWTGACTNATGTCTALVNADKNVTARFTLIPLADGDRDGVPDISDRCRLTPENLRTQVNALGCVRPRMTRFNIRPPVEGDITAVNNVELGITNVAKIKFDQPVALGRTDGVIDLDTNVVIEQERVEIKSAIVPELNKPSTITMYGVTKNNPRILKDGQECISPTCNIQSYTDGVLVFTVTGFSVYTVEETLGTQPTTTPEPETSGRRRRGGGGGGSRTTVTPTVSNETLIQQLTAQLNLLIAQLNSLTGSRTPVVTSGTSFNVTLALGSRHPDVRRLQQKLTSLGYAVPATGYYGPQTVLAVKKFQAARGIKQTGTAGTLTRAQLNK